MVLAGDVGGTKIRLALVEDAGGGAPRVLREATLASRAHASLDDAIAAFLAGGPAGVVEAVCVGVAGPVIDGRCVATNLAWEVSEAQLARAAGARRARLLNDLEAAGHGVLTLDPAALRALQPGAPRRGNVALIAAGTGLGEALLVWDGRRHLVVPSEGGHADFAPRTDLEIELLAFLRKEHGRVSYERVLSGPGLLAVYRFLRQGSGVPEPAWLAARMAADDPSAAIAEAALDGEDAVCGRALDLFVSVYGAEAGNLALKALALGGVFVGGGIAPKIVERLSGGGFVDAFRDKGRLADLMATIPVHVVLDDRAALLGAALVGLALARGAA